MKPLAIFLLVALRSCAGSDHLHMYVSDADLRTIEASAADNARLQYRAAVMIQELRTRTCFIDLQRVDAIYDSIGRALDAQEAAAFAAPAN